MTNAPATADLKTPDALPSSWVDRLPEGFRPYLRLMRADRPVGVWLLFLPCLWGTLLARPDGTGADKVVGLALLFFIGAYAMRSAGCVYNDIVDRDLDAQVARTASRPLASGRVRLAEAWALLLALCGLGFVVLIQLPLLAIVIGLAALGLVAAYPFMKRITWWPQAWLGLTFNWGVLVSAASVSGEMRLSALLLYGAGIAWTLGYDTIYAHQDREDDALAGIKSSARALGQQSRLGIAIFYGSAVLLAGAALLLEGAGLKVLLILPAAGHFVWQLNTLDTEDSLRCLTLFKSNVVAGWFIALACLGA